MGWSPGDHRQDPGNTDGEDYGKRFGESEERILEWKLAIAGVRTELLAYRISFRNDINDLRRHFCRLLLAQTVLIVDLVLILDWLLPHP